jgi:hypothetical protein
MYVRVDTVSPRLSGHHAALFLGALSVMRDALALASGVETDRIMARLEAIDGPGVGERARLTRPSLQRSRRAVIDHLALAGQQILVSTQPKGRTTARESEDAEGTLGGDAALRSLLVHGLLHGVSSDDGFEVEQLESGTLATVIKDGVKSISSLFAQSLSAAQDLLPVPDRDPGKARTAVIKCVAQAAGGPATPSVRTEDYAPTVGRAGAVGVTRNPHFIAAALMVVAQEELRRTLAAMKATDLLVSVNGVDGEANG